MASNFTDELPFQYFLFLHLTSMISCFTAMYYVNRGDKSIKKESFLKGIYANFKNFHLGLYYSAKLKPALFLLTVCAFISLYPAMKIILSSFMEEIDKPDEIVNNLRLMSGHWAFFSYIAVIMFYLVLPLKETANKFINKEK